MAKTLGKAYGPSTGRTTNHERMIMAFMPLLNRYHDQVDVIVEGFRYELCHECGLDLDGHMIMTDPLGNAQAFCRTEGR